MEQTIPTGWFAGIFRFLRGRPGLALLIVLFGVIAAVTIKPGFYLLGWDNYSSYFALPTNLFRTFFVAWREYRGLGVPSDSEAVDLFHQLFAYILSPVLSEPLLEQAYMLVALGVGLFAMYWFSYLLFKRSLPELPHRLLDLGSFIAAIFYLCNLNTLATFYFPMIMYTNRFFSLPLLFLIFFLLLHKKRISVWQYIACLIGIFFAAGSFVTATILVTVVIALFFFGLTQQNKKRFALIFSFYLLLNAFWLFSFANYTIQKSSIIRLAPNFVTANETQLNKPASVYEIGKQLTTYHNFFDTPFHRISDGKEGYFHSMHQSYEQRETRAILWIFPALYLLGSIILIFRFKQYKALLFLPMMLFVFLFLSMKEHSILGFIYSLLNDTVPYFGVLFRFGDTKFHAFIAFSGSLLAAFTIISILRTWSFAQRYLLLAIIVLPTLFVFRGYFQGQLIGPFMYNKLPLAYSEIADIINSDPSTDARVLQLPFDSQAYWRSYSWGAFGSTFLNFMLNKPFVDKAFEPASMENAMLHRRINDFLFNMQLVSKEEDKKKRAEEFAAMLRKVGIKYLIFDDTVAANVAIRGILLWGDFNNPDVSVMMDTLTDYDLARVVSSYTIDLSEQAKGTITLLEVENIAPRVQFLQSATYLDPFLNNAFEKGAADTSFVLQDRESSSFAMSPFNRVNADFAEEADGFSLTFQQRPSEGTLSFQTSQGQNSAQTSYVDVYERQEGSDVVLSLMLVQTPAIAQNPGFVLLKELRIPLARITSSKSSQLSDFISDWEVLPDKTVGGLRLRVGEYVMPLPARRKSTMQYVGTIAVFGNSMPLEILSFQKSLPLTLALGTETQYPNCFFDQLKGAAYSIKKDNNISVVSTNQSTCFFYDLKPFLEEAAHAEIRLKAQGKSEDLDEQYISSLKTSKPALTSYVRSLRKPNLLRLCAKEARVDDCHNLHQFVHVSENADVVFPLEWYLGDISDMVLLLSLKNTGFQKQEMTIEEIAIDTFSPIMQDSLVIPAMPFTSPTFSLPDGQWKLKIPKALSLQSFFFNPEKEGLYGFNPACDEGGYRTFRTVNGKLFTYIVDCYTDIYQQMQFQGDNTFLWSLSYNLLSGKFPRFSVSDEVLTYANDFVSLSQGYPDIEGFKRFADPEMWYQHLLGQSTASQVKTTIDGLSMQQAYGFLPAHPELADTSKKQWSIHQDGENEGAMLIDRFAIQPLPSAWKDLTLVSDGQEEQFQVPSDFEFERLLPSLVHVSIDASEDGAYLLFFNEGYDAQWRAYESFLGALSGFGTSYESIKCQGYANCFKIQNKEGKAKKLYILYTPERLAMLGWILTLLTIIGGGVIFTRRKHNETRVNSLPQV